MEYGYYRQPAMTATCHSTFMYHPPQATAVDNAAATIEQLKREFFNETQTPRSITPQSKSPKSPKRKPSIPNIKNHLSEDHLAIGMIVFVQPKSDHQENCKCVLPDCQRRKLDARGHNHPAVILDVQDNRLDGGELIALCCIVSLSS